MDKRVIENILNITLTQGADYGEIFFEENFSTEISLVGSELERGMSGKDFGVGIRIFKGLRSIYTYTNNLDEQNLYSMTNTAMKTINQATIHAQIILPDVKSIDYNKYKILSHQKSLNEKLDIMKLADKAAVDYDKSVIQATINYLDLNQDVIIANTEGVYVNENRQKTRMLMIVAAEHNGEIETGWTGPGAMKGLEFYDEIDVKKYAVDAARVAVTMSKADYCPAGEMAVVVDHGFGGLMFHEACGHSLEASSVAKGHSEFSNKLGQKVASDVLSYIDDGSLLNEWGSLGIDDEGVKTQKNILIENGVLKGYMIDRLNGKRMGMSPTGSSRRQSYRFAPTSRMTNTYIANGTSKREEIISNTEKGLLVTGISAGSVNPSTGDFNFSLSEAYLIDGGEITKPVKGASLIGKGGEILKNVDMVADNLKIDQGYCYAESGALFIGAGQPTIRVKNLTVGGRS